jgi:hypothetical protein
MTKELYKKLIARPEPVRNILCKIAEEELLEGRTELIDVGTVSYKDKIYKLTVINEELGMVWATVQLKGIFDDEGYVWKLLDLEWEGER